MQGLKRCNPLNIVHVSNEFQDLVNDVGIWCSSRRLQLNARKTEIIWFGSSSNLSKLNPVNKKLHLDGSVVEASETVRDLGAFFDSELTMRQHIAIITRTCFFHLRRLRSIRRQLGSDVAKRLVSAFVLSRIDYSNALFAGLPDVALEPLQPAGSECGCQTYSESEVISTISSSLAPCKTTHFIQTLPHGLQVP